MSRTLQRILYAEDEDDIRLITAMALRTFGDFVVSENDSGLNIVEKARDFAPDLILLDVMMPNVDGPTAWKHLKETPELADIPVVFMTAKVLNDETRTFLAAGAAGIIAKPFDPQELSGQLREIWGQADE